MSNFYSVFCRQNFLPLTILTSCGEGASLALVGYHSNPSSDGITIEIPYGVDGFLRRPASHPIFSYRVC